MALSVAKGRLPVGVLPVGSGKSLVISEIIRRILKKDFNKRILALVDTKELIEQNYNEFCGYAGHKIASYTGIYSAGLGRKEHNEKIVFAGIQSYAKICHKSEPVDFIIIDECHLVPVKKNSQYRKVLAIEKEKNPKVACMGFTGTPWRFDLKERLITESDGFFNEIAYFIGFRVLIKLGYLCPVMSYDRNITSAVLTNVAIKNGDFRDDLATKAFLEVLPAQVKEIIVLGKDRKKWIIFCQTKEHALAMFALLKENTDRKIAYVFGDSPDRDEKIADFISSKITVLINIQVLIKGFNCVDIDFVVLCFATKSVSKYVQSVGRGMRTAEEKKNCLVLDFGQNIERHGPIDEIRPKKKKEEVSEQPLKRCEKCKRMIQINLKFCIYCGHEFPSLIKEEGKNLTERSKKGGIISTEDEFVEVNLMFAKLILTKVGHKAMVIEFFISKYQRWPTHKEFFSLWHDKKNAVNKSFEKLNQLIPNNRDLLESLMYYPENLVNIVNDLIKNKEIPVPKFIFLKRTESNGKKYKEITGVSY